MEIRAANLGSNPALSVKNFEEIFNGEVSPSVAKGGEMADSPHLSKGKNSGSASKVINVSRLYSPE